MEEALIVHLGDADIPWRAKAHTIIAALCRASYLAAQTKYDGTRYVRHRLYEAQQLAGCLRSNNEEAARTLLITRAYKNEGNRDA